MVYTKLVATKIAGYGADKMDAQGYKMDAMKGIEGGFYTIKPAQPGEDVTIYLTVVQGEFTSCTCPFHADNGVCKHTVKAERIIADDARIAALEEAYQDFLDDRMAAEADAANRSAVAVWPVCATHGRYTEAANGTPMSFCEGCESAL